jgi:hypothetical protein
MHSYNIQYVYTPTRQMHPPHIWFRFATADTVVVGTHIYTR